MTGFAERSTIILKGPKRVNFLSSDRFPVDPQSLFMFAAIGFLVILMVMQSRKRKKQAEELANSLAVGVWVMLTSGIYGEVVAVNEDRVSLRAGDATLVVAKGAVLRTVDAPAEAAKPKAETKKPAVAKVSAAKKPAAPKEPASKQRASKTATKTSK